MEDETRWWSLRQRDERLTLFDDIGPEFGRIDVADVLCCVHGSGRNKQDTAGVDRHRRLAVVSNERVGNRMLHSGKRGPAENFGECRPRARDRIVPPCAPLS